MRPAAMLVFLGLGLGLTATTQTSDPDPMLTRTVLLEDFSDPALPGWQLNRQGGSIDAVNGALRIQASTLTGRPTVTTGMLQNLSVTHCLVEFDLTHRNTLGEAAVTFKNSGDSWYEVQFDAAAGQVRLEKWSGRRLALAGVHGVYAMEKGATYHCRLGAVENHVFAQISPDGIRWTTLFHVADTEVTAPGTVRLIARDRKDVRIDNLRVRAVAGSPTDPVPRVVQKAWTDDFGDEDTVGWVHELNGGIASLSGGRLLLKSIPGAATRSRIHGLHLRNFCLEATLVLTGVAGTAEVDLKLDTTGRDASLYRVILDPTVSQVRLEEHAGRVVTPRGSGAYFLAQNAAYDLQLICFEGWVFVGLRGNGNTRWNHVISHFGTTVLPAGGIRVSAVNGKEVRIDNVVVRAIARLF